MIPESKAPLEISQLGGIQRSSLVPGDERRPIGVDERYRIEERLTVPNLRSPTDRTWLWVDWILPSMSFAAMMMARMEPPGNSGDS